MNDSDELDAIRERKRRELMERTGDETEPGGVSTSASEVTPTDPIRIDGDDDLAAVVDRYGTVLVDFYADWCGPCQMLEPTVETIARTTSAAIAKVDIDAHPSLAQQNGVRGVPTLVLYADGDPVERLVGVQDESTLRSLVETYAQ